ncbi:16S rRNA (uracil(1498)-N(3))-methyltransferase [Evansella sp. AB-rgal1]|uniref:16S rRNA (uracil(1498)-N(3))-methyltransferase n=1 Tax=Evansella sp. AB-rgal1 TaxID=3242696 RepID=UPI00359D46AE
MQRYFLEKEHFHSDYVMITDEAAKHIRRVMRMKTGDTVVCCDEDGQCFISEIVDLQEDYVKASILLREEKKVELPVSVTIAHGLPKADKFELVIQKATELGAASFIPFPGERSVVKWEEKKADKKVERWNKIAKEAAEQAHRQIVPSVKSVMKTEELCKQFANYTYVLVAYEEAAKNDEKSQLFSVLSRMKQGNTLLFLFGPEGGFSDREIKLFQEHGAIICGLGPRILRSETAPLYSLAAISYHLELLG